MSRRLERSATNRVISGVCGGIADYLAIDATLVRVFFVIATIVTAFLFILVYIALLILMPLPGERPLVDELWPGARTGDPSATGSAASSTSTSPDIHGERNRNTIGYVLVALGLVFLLANMGAFRFMQWQLVWPLALIALGALLLLQRTRR